MMNNSTPKISIVLPTYNGAKYLRQAIESCLKQTYDNIELIIVDDCSSDNTPDIIKSFSDRRVRYIRNEKNLRLPSSLNVGFKNAAGEYLTWTSDDNQFLPTAIEEMLDVLKNHPDGAFVYTDYYVMDLETGQTLLKQIPSKLNMGKLNRIGACFLYKREVYETIGDYNPYYGLVEDYDYWIRISKRFKMIHYPKALYIYGEHPHSLTSKKIAHVQLLDKFLKFHHGFIPLKELIGGINFYLVNMGKAVTNTAELPISWLNMVKKISRLSISGSVLFLFISLFSLLKGIEDFLLTAILFFPRMILNHFRIKKMCNNLKAFPNRKNILCFIPAMVVGGSEKVVASIIRSFNNPGHAFHLMTIKKENNKWCDQFCSWFQNSILLNKMHHDLFYQYAAAIIKTLNIDLIIISNSASAYHFLPKLKSYFPDLKVVDILHLEDTVGAKREFFFAVPHIDARVCISEYLKNYMIAKYRRCGVEEKYQDKLIMIHNGTEMLDNHHHLKKGSFKLRYHIPEDTKIISFIHRFSSEKNHLLFVEIAHALIAQTPPQTFKFVMAGDGKRFNEVQEKINELGLEEHFILTGLLDDVSELLIDTYLLVIVSGKEGIPLVLLEALALHIPVISTNVGGISEAIQDGVNGYLVNPLADVVSQVTSKILNLLGQEKQYAQLVTKTRVSIANEYSLKNMGRRYQKTFEGLLAD